MAQRGLWTGDEAPAPFMVPATKAAQIAGISPQRLWYWEHTGLIQPTYRREVTPRTIIRLYALDRLMELLVAARLVDKPGISLQHIRKVLRHLRKYGYDAPLRQLKFAVTGREVFFMDEHGVWEGSRRPGQTVIPYTVDLAAIEARIYRAAPRRSSKAAGRIEKRRHVLASKPVFQDTRIPVSAVFEYLNAGASDREILTEYPALRRPDLEKARVLHAAATRLKQGASPKQVRTEFPSLTDEDLRSVKQLVAAA